MVLWSPLNKQKMKRYCIQKNMGMRANCGSSMITGNWLFNQPVLCPNQTWRWGQFRAIPSKFPGRDKWTQSNWISSSPQLVTGSFGEVLVFPISMANLRCQQHRFHEYIFLDMVPIVEATTSLRTSSTQGFPSWKIVVSPVTRLEGPTPNFWGEVSNSHGLPKKYLWFSHGPRTGAPEVQSFWPSAQLPLP